MSLSDSHATLKQPTLAALPLRISLTALSCIPHGEHVQFRQNPEEYLRLKRNKLLSGEWSIKACPLTSSSLWDAVAKIAHLLPPTWPRHPRKAFDKSPLAWLKTPGFSPKLWLSTMHAVEQHCLGVVDAWHTNAELHQHLNTALQAGHARHWRIGDPLLKRYERIMLREMPNWAPSEALEVILDRQISPEDLRALHGLAEALEALAARPGPDANLNTELADIGSETPTAVLDAAIFALLEQTAAYYPNRKRLEAILRQRLGLTPNGTTLQDIGAVHNLTRERVRQLLAHYADYELLPTPHRHRVTVLIQSFALALPGSTTRPDQKVIDFASNLDVVTLIERLSEFACCPPPVVTLNTLPQASLYSISVAADAAPLVDLVAWTARRHIHSNGLCELGRVLIESIAKRTEGNPAALTPDFVSTVIEKRLRLLPVSAEGVNAAWYWSGPERQTTLITRIRKALSVTDQRIDAQQLHAAVYRSSSKDFNREDKQIIPSASVLLAVCSQMPNVGALMWNDLYRIDPDKDGPSILSPTETVIYETLLASDGTSNKATLTEAVTKKTGATPMTVAYALADSPIVVSLGEGLYQLLGHPIVASALARAAETIPSYGKRMNVRRRPVTADSTIRTHSMPDGAMQILIPVVDITLDHGISHFTKDASIPFGSAIRVQIEDGSLVLPIRRWEAAPGTLIARLTLIPLLQLLRPEPNTVIELRSDPADHSSCQVISITPLPSTWD